MVDGNEIRITGEVCKNRRPRVIPIGPELAEILARRKKARRVIPMAGVTQLAEPIFHRGDGLPIGEPVRDDSSPQASRRLSPAS
jgi:integrase